ncbi:hypothetical protein [Amycolatopsis minnesotensis]|uniref:hypothetical protein n=1 Tax=Amycolatopsis minnesotensis TaxID=337894 RepID=UPI003CD09BBF
MRSRVVNSVSAMQKSHRTCKRCGRDTGRWLPTSTWTCDECYLLAEKQSGAA